MRPGKMDRDNERDPGTSIDFAEDLGNETILLQIE
jgi:hypothetical protein